MKLRALTDEQAVSPVIGVILMVAITVILAAVIASFVLGLGETSVTPTASFSFDYEEPGQNLTITHDGGDSVRQSELYLRGSGFNSSFPNQASNSNDPGDAVDHTDSGQWAGDTSTTIGEESAVTGGDRAAVHVESDYELRVVWQSQDDGESATLGDDSGPDT